MQNSALITNIRDLYKKIEEQTQILLTIKELLIEIKDNQEIGKENISGTDRKHYD